MKAKAYCSSQAHPRAIERRPLHTEAHAPHNELTGAQARHQAIPSAPAADTGQCAVTFGVYPGIYRNNPLDARINCIDNQSVQSLKSANMKHTLTLEETLRHVTQLAETLERFGLSEIEIASDHNRIRIRRDAQPMVASQSAPLPETSIGTKILSPSLGTFYAKPSPEAPDFVGLNHHVHKDQVVGLVECMKVFHPIKAPCSGRIISIEARHAHSVEFNQVLMVLMPDAS